MTKDRDMVAAMMAALNVGERLFLGGHEHEAIAILAAIQSLQSENIQLSSTLELTAMAARNETSRLRRLLEQEQHDSKFHDYGGYTMVPKGEFLALKNVAIDWAQKKAKATAINKENAKKPRASLYPEWMQEAVLYYAKGRKKPSATLAQDAVKTEAASRGYVGNLPTLPAIRKWISKKKPNDR